MDSGTGLVILTRFRRRPPRGFKPSGKCGRQCHPTHIRAIYSWSDPSRCNPLKHYVLLMAT